MKAHSNKHNGRIGRLSFRRLVEDADIEIVAINDNMPADNLAYQLKFDSIYAIFKNSIDSGVFKNKEKVVKHLAAGAGKVSHFIQVQMILT